MDGSAGYVVMNLSIIVVLMALSGLCVFWNDLRPHEKIINIVLLCVFIPFSILS